MNSDLESALDRHWKARAALIASPRPAAPSPVRPVHPFHRRPDRVNVGVLNFMLAGVGGIETWMAALARTIGDDRIHLVGFAAGSETPGPCADAVRSACPVAIGHDATRHLVATSDVLIASGPLDWPALGLRPGQRLVFVSHGADDWARRAAVAAEPFTHQYVAVHQAALDVVPAHRRADAVVIENAIDGGRLEPSTDRSTLRTRFGWTGPTLLFVGRLAPDKRPGIAVAALAHLPGWTLAIVGDGLLRDDLGRQATDLGVADRVRFLGARSDVGDLLHAADTLIQCSPKEGFGLAAVEALWVGLPVASSPVGVFEENPELAAIVPSGETDPERWAQALATIRNAQADRARTGRAQAFARNRWDAARWGRTWADLVVAVGKPTPTTIAAPAVGDRIHAVLARFGFRESPGCGCSSLQNRMNALGPAGCRREARDLAAAMAASLPKLLRFPGRIAARVLIVAMAAIVSSRDRG